MSDNAKTNIELDLPQGSIITNRIEIVTYLDPSRGFEDNFIVGCKSNNGNDHHVPLITALGMLEIAKGMIASPDEEGSQDD